jgi:Tfp pilus assembly protein PilN
MSALALERSHITLPELLAALALETELLSRQSADLQTLVSDLMEGTATRPSILSRAQMFDSVIQHLDAVASVLAELSRTVPPTVDISRLKVLDGIGLSGMAARLTGGQHAGDDGDAGDFEFF